MTATIHYLHERRRTPVEPAVLVDRSRRLQHAWNRWVLACAALWIAWWLV